MLRLSDELKAVRAKLRITQAEMAEHLGLSRTGYSIIERGQAKRLHVLAARWLLENQHPQLIEDQLAKLFEAGQPEWWLTAQRLYVCEGLTQRAIGERVGKSVQAVGPAVNLAARRRARALSTVYNHRRAERRRQLIATDPEAAERIHAYDRERWRRQNEQRKKARALPAGVSLASSQASP